MKKILSIAFSILILFQGLTINASDLYKLNTLIEHASFHKKAHGDSFVEFLEEHYINSTFHNQDNHQEHQDLPFKSHKENCQNTSTSFTFNILNYSFENKGLVKNLFNFFYTENITIFEKPLVFQPPKLV